MGAEGDEVHPSGGVVTPFEANGTPLMFFRVVFHRSEKTDRFVYEDSQFWGGEGDRHPVISAHPDVVMLGSQVSKVIVSICLQRSWTQSLNSRNFHIHHDRQSKTSNSHHLFLKLKLDIHR
jgi:hypothetical protein